MICIITHFKDANFTGKTEMNNTKNMIKENVKASTKKNRNLRIHDDKL